jgi:hypothetical protein
MGLLVWIILEDFSRHEQMGISSRIFVTIG